MKKLLFITIALIASLASCSDEQEETIMPKEDFIKLSADRLIANPEGGDVELKVESSGPWRITGISDWIAPTVTEGENGESIVFSAEANHTDEIREASFKVFTGTAVQKVMIVSDPITRLKFVSKPGDFASLSTASQTLAVTFESNVSEEELTYEIVSENGEPWVTIGKKNEAFGQRSVMLDVKENKTYINRKNTLVIKGKEEEISLDLWQQPVKYLSAETKFFQVDNTEQDVEVEIITNTEYEIKAMPDWMTKGNIVKGETREDGLHVETVTMHVGASQFTRSGSFQVFYKGSYYREFEMTISQTNPNPPTIDIENKGLREALQKAGWVIIRDGNTCELLEKSTSKSLDISKAGLSSLAGIEKFPHIETLYLNDNNLEEVDITSLKNVKSINVTNNNNLSNIKLGDNPIQSIAVGGLYGKLDCSSLTISGNSITEINADYKFYSADKLKELDVTGCPNLKTCNAFRGASWGTTVYLEKIYVTAAQKESAIINIKAGTEIVVR